MNRWSLNIGGDCDTLVVVDDTLVVAADPYRAETHMRCMNATVMNYGLRLHWKKREVLPIGCEANITAPDGNFFHAKNESHINEVIWMHVAWLVRKFAED